MCDRAEFQEGRRRWPVERFALWTRVEITALLAEKALYVEEAPRYEVEICYTVKSS